MLISPFWFDYSNIVAPAPIHSFSDLLLPIERSSVVFRLNDYELIDVLEALFSLA
jgi:hypothetical protein